MHYFTTFMLFLVNLVLFGSAAFFCHNGNGHWAWFLGVGVFVFLMTLGYVGQSQKISSCDKPD